MTSAPSNGLLRPSGKPLHPQTSAAEGERISTAGVQGLVEERGPFQLQVNAQRHAAESTPGDAHFVLCLFWPGSLRAESSFSSSALHSQMNGCHKTKLRAESRHLQISPGIGFSALQEPQDSELPNVLSRKRAMSSISLHERDVLNYLSVSINLECQNHKCN